MSVRTWPEVSECLSKCGQRLKSVCQFDGG